MKAEWDRLEGLRRTFDLAAETAAGLTIPAVFPPERQVGELGTPSQSLGAQGVTNLASQFLLSQFPASHHYFTLLVNRYAVASEYGLDPVQDQEALNEIMREINDAIVGIVEEAHNFIDTDSQLRSALMLAYPLLIVTGNVCLRMNDEGAPTVYTLRSYVVERDPTDALTKLILRDTMAKAAAPAEVRPHFGDKEQADLFTKCCLVEGAWQVSQAIDDNEFLTTKFSAEEFPYIVVRAKRDPYQPYGHAIVSESLLGDLMSLETLTTAVNEMAQVCAWTIPFVNENSAHTPQQMARMKNREWRTGRATDVTFLRLDKTADMQFALSRMQALEMRLDRWFLNPGAFQRDAERVTAEEITRIHQKIQESHAGSHAMMVAELVTVLIKHVLRIMAKRELLPSLPPKAVSVSVTAGVQGLARGRALNDLVTGAGTLQNLFPEQSLLHPLELASRVLRALAVDPRGLLKTQETLSEEAKARQQAVLEQEVAPTVAQEAMQ